MNRSELNKRAFTLIELLVVVSIISLLISITVPSLRRSREAARKAQCLTNLRSVYLANTMYVQQEGRYPSLNNDLDDGAWQYNYLIYDGRDYESNWGPLVKPGAGFIDYIEQLYCPVQRDEYHNLATRFNSWPVRLLVDTRSAYGRRYHLSGKSPSQLRKTVAFASDVMHLPDLIKSGHKTGVNAVYTDGHGQWVRDPGLLGDNDLASPFSILDNPLMKDLWKVLDKAK